MSKEKNIFIRCCYGYAVSGAAVLSIGALLPYIMKEGGLSYSLAGGLLSMMAIGNLLASFVFPVLSDRIGRRRGIFFMSALVPVCYLILTRLPGTAILYLLMFLAGLGRGSITITNNLFVNTISHHSGKALNLLHGTFAIGSFIALFLTAFLLSHDVAWRTVMYLLVILCFSSVLTYGTMDVSGYDQTAGAKKAPDGANAADPGKEAKEDRSFLKNFYFYCVSLLLFFYLGTENCVNGWFVTYLQDTGVMSETYATNMVSVTWLVILIGRLACSHLSQIMKTSRLIALNALGSGICFFLLIATKQLAVITLAQIGFGLFLAGIYPTCVANLGPIIKDSAMGMSLMMAVASLGGIITPQLVGVVADRIGLVAAMSLLSVNIIMVLVLSLVNMRRKQ